MRAVVDRHATFKTKARTINVDDKCIWQVAAGDTDRSYPGILLEWDVIAYGPGYAGSWPECAASLRREKVSERQISVMRRFREEIREGHLIVLRLGTTDVYGVGEVVGEAVWLDDFGDIDGWDLQHVRRVRWLWKYDDQPKRFDPYTLKWGDTVLEMDAEPVKEWLGSIEVPENTYARDLIPLPPSCNDGKRGEDSDPKEIGDFLFDRGVAAASVDSLLQQMDELVRVAEWYQRANQATSEHETVAYLAVPLLRALGWTPQKMALEWNHVDIALFGQLPRGDESLRVVVEAKKRNWSCLSAKSQAESYAEQPDREKCRRLIVTDGLRYGVYVRDVGGKFPPGPCAYLNLIRMRNDYPILKCGGAKEALLVMAADWDGKVPGRDSSLEEN